MTTKKSLFKDFTKFLNEKSSSTSKFTDYKIMLITSLFNDNITFINNTTTEWYNNNKLGAFANNAKKQLTEKLDEIKENINGFISSLNSINNKNTLKKNFIANISSKIELLPLHDNNIIKLAFLKSYFEYDINNNNQNKIKLTPNLLNFIKELIKYKKEKSITEDKIYAMLESYNLSELKDVNIKKLLYLIQKIIDEPVMYLIFSTTLNSILYGNTVSGNARNTASANSFNRNSNNFVNVNIRNIPTNSTKRKSKFNILSNRLNSLTNQIKRLTLKGAMRK
jgi:hypothetical protein